MNYLSFDLGTTRIKSSLFNDDGDIIYSTENNSSIYNNNGIYQNPDDYLNSIVSNILEIKNTRPKEFLEIEYIITSGQMGGTLGIDESLKVVIPWTYSLDLRYLEYVYNFESAFGKEIREKSGGPPTISGKIAWIKKVFPDKYEKISKFINLMCYVSLKLCDLKIKDAFIDCTCLSMSGIADILKLQWDNQLCKKTNIDIEKLPKISLPFEEIGIISRNKFKTRKNIKVLAGCGDQVAGFIGAGVVNNNNIIDVSGTYNLIGLCCEKFFGDSKFNVFHSIYTGIKNIYYQLAVISAGGHTFEWFIKNFRYKSKNTIHDYQIPSNIFLTPFLGGRYSPTQPYFKGSYLNLEWKNSLDDMYISLLESGGYELNNFIDMMCSLNNLTRENFKEIKVIGSGAGNMIENYTKANILNLRYLLLKKRPYENIGTFIIAKYKDKIIDGVSDLTYRGIIKTEAIINPDKLKVKEYGHNILKYNKIVNLLANLYAEIQDV